MTVTLVYADTMDGHLRSNDPSYAVARSGPADSYDDTGSVAYYGQAVAGGVYSLYQTFLRFAYPAVATTESVVTAVIRTNQYLQASPGVARDMEIRAYDWGVDIRDLTDWRGVAQLDAAAVYARVRGVHGSQGRDTYTGSETLRAYIAGGSTAGSFVVVSSRQKNGNVPTGDETSAIWTVNAGGTSLDPCLIFTTTPKTRLTPIMGADAQLSDESWVIASRSLGSSSVTLIRVAQNGTETTIGSVPVGGGSTDWADVPAAQGLTLTVDASDNIYVVGREGTASNAARVQAFKKITGSWTWTAGTPRSIPLPEHDAPANNFTAAWHSTAGGTLAIFAAHQAGDGDAYGKANDMACVLLGSASLLSGTSTTIRGVFSALAAGFGLLGLPSRDFNGYANETGTGLDVVADRGQSDWGYLVSFKRGQGLGGNAEALLSRYVLNPDGTGFYDVGYQELAARGRKDASTKLRVLSVGSGRVAVVSADGDSGYGLSVQVLQANRLSTGFTSLGYVRLADESIGGMPDGPEVGAILAWDATYSVNQNMVWVYYARTTPVGIWRTSVSLDTCRATRVVVQVSNLGDVRALRVARNGWATQRGCLSYDTTAAPGRIVDTYNQAPLAPILTTRLNYDATQAATFVWTFKDPNAGDTQSAYQLQVVRVSDGVTVLDTGKVLSTTSSRSVAGGTFVNGVDYRWRVMTWDAINTAGPWSGYGTFSTSAAGSVNITSPAVDNPPDVITDDYPIAWSVTGTTQARVRTWITRNDTGAVVQDSGWFTYSGTTGSVSNMVSDVEHTIRVQVENASGVRSGIGTRLITPGYASPEAPLVTLTPVPESGYMLVSVENPIPGEPSAPAPTWTMEAGADLSAWTRTAATLALSTEQAYSGTQSAKLTATSTVTAAVKAPIVTVTPSQRYVARCWLRSPEARDVGVDIDWFLPGGGYITTSRVQTPVAANTWALVSVTATAPATAGMATYGFSIRSSLAAGATAYGDDLLLSPLSDRPDVIRNRVLRRRLGSTGAWEVVGECGPDGSFRDYTAPARTPVEYIARGESA